MSLPFTLRREAGDGAGHFPALCEMFRNLLKETGGALERLTVGRIQPQFRIGEVELLLATGDTHVKKPSLLLKGRVILHGAGTGEHPLGQPCNENGLPLQSFGLMDA